MSPGVLKLWGFLNKPGLPVTRLTGAELSPAFNAGLSPGSSYKDIEVLNSYLLLLSVERHTC